MSEPMADPSPPQRKSFDAQLWALHRNSLLFSGLLIILCLPGVTVSEKQTVYWIQINGATLSRLQWISFLSALYAIVAFFLEWLHEVWPFWREQDRQLKTIAEGIDQVINLSSTAIESQRTTLRDALIALHSSEDALKSCADRGYIGTGALEQHLIGMMTDHKREYLTGKILRRLPADNGQGPRFSSSQVPDKTLEDAVRSAVTATHAELVLEGKPAFGSDQLTTSKYIEENLNKAKEALEAFGSTQAGMDLSPLGFMRFSLRGRKGSLVARVWLVSLFVPVLLFAIGIYQFIRLLT